ncbi:hypothetical protein Tco_1311165 [Tanacetum coccineum]
MSNTSDKGTMFGDGVARVGMQLRSSPKRLFEIGGPLVRFVHLRSNSLEMSMDTRLLKEELTCIPVWVKLHDVPIQVFEEDGNSEADLVDVVTIGIPSLSEDDFTKKTIQFEYEFEAAQIETIKIFEERKGKSKSTNGGQYTGPLVKHNVIYEPKATTSAPKKGTTYVGYTSQSTPMLKTTGNSSKKNNLSMSNSFSALNEKKQK